MSQQGKGFKQRFYWKLNKLSVCRPELLSGNFQSENVAGGKNFKQRYYRMLYNLRLCSPVLLSGNIQSEHVAAGERIKTTISWKY